MSGLAWAFTGLGILVAVCVIGFAWALCAVAAESDRRQAEFFQDQQPQPLAWLEQDDPETLAMRKRVRADVQAWKAMAKARGRS